VATLPLASILAAGALAQDDGFLYFTCEAQGSIKRLKKP